MDEGVNTASTRMALHKEKDEKKDDEMVRPHGTEDFAVARIREALASDYARLSAVATLLGRDGLTDSVYAKAADVCRALADVAPAARDALASALSAQVRSRIEDAVANLESVRFTASVGRTAQTMGAKEAEAEAAAAAAAAKLPPSVASSGSAILRVSHVVAALLKFDVDAAKREETEAAGNALAAAGAGPSEVIPPPRSGADVEAERRRRRKAMGRAIQSFADELNPVWAALSEACTVLEPQIAAAAAVAAASSRGGTAAPALPAGARQIQPVVEAYFALAAAINDASKRVAPEASVEEPGGRNATISSPERGGVMGSDEGLVSSNAAPSGLDADDRAAAFRASRGGPGSSSRPPGSGARFVRRVADAFGGGTWRAMHTIESAPDRIYPRWRLYSSAMYAFFVYTVGMMAGWHYVVRPSARFMFGLELAPLPFQVWGHGQRMLLQDGAWVPDLGYYGSLRERVRRNMIRDRVRARLREMDRAEAEEAASDEAANAASPPREEAAFPEGEPRPPPPPRVDVARETPETLPPEEELGDDRSYSPFEPIDCEALVYA